MAGKFDDKLDENTDNESLLGTKLGLTRKQIRIAQILADPSETRTIKSMCKDEGVPRRTFYHWMEKKVFIDFINSLIDKYMDAELASIWGALARKARTGETAAIKLFFEMKGKYRETKEINHTIDNISDDEMEKRIQELMNKVGDNTSASNKI